MINSKVGRTLFELCLEKNYELMKLVGFTTLPSVLNAWEGYLILKSQHLFPPKSPNQKLWQNL
jgi:hypothetical protein